MSPRAPRLSADDRRTSIVASTKQLILAGQQDLTTRQIAEAAGVAEGTLFRVFDDKDAILHAVVIDAIRPEPILKLLSQLEKDQSLGELIAELVSTMSARVREIFDIAMAVRWMPKEVIEPRPELDPIQLRIIELLGAHRDELSVAPEKAAEALRLLIFASSHPMINEGRPLAAADIVALILDGVRGRPAAKTTTTTRKPRAPRAKSP